MVLNPGFKRLAEKLQEASLSFGDIRTQLQDALRDKFPSNYPYILDIYGDENSGEVVYACDGGTSKCGYELSMAGGKRGATLSDPIEVLPRTVYDEVGTEEDHYAAMEAGLGGEKLYTELPVYERFISKAERDAATADDFAGKGRSFPILKPADIDPAVRSMGRAGSANLGPSGIKSRIIAIAKRKGWTKHLPKAWQSDQTAEASVPGNEGLRLLVESANGMQGWAATEADIPPVDGLAKKPAVKIISPGRGSSGYYTAEMLRRDGPAVFKRGTLMYVNHATAAEEAARPEGDWNNLAAVLEEDASWMDNGPDGPGLYSTPRIFSKYAAEVKEKAPYTGVSIRAYGKFDAQAIAPDGKPGVVQALHHAESVDLVTQAGRDGKLLLESAARQAREGQDEMTEDQVKAIVANAVKEATAPLVAENLKFRGRLHAVDVASMIDQHHATIEGHAGAKTRARQIILAGSIPVKETGEVDVDKVKTLIESTTKGELDYAAQLLGQAGVRGMGAAPAGNPAELTEAEYKTQMVDSLMREGLSKEAAEQSLKLTAGVN